MREAKFRRFGRWMSFLGIFIAGMAVGSSLFMGMYHKNFNRLLIMNSVLQTEKEKLLADVESLNKYKNTQTIVKSITVHIYPEGESLPLDPLAEQEIKRRVLRDLNSLKGQPVKTISASSLTMLQLMKQKIYPGVQEKDYAVSIRGLFVIHTDLQVWITVQEFRR